MIQRKTSFVIKQILCYINIEMGRVNNYSSKVSSSSKDFNRILKNKIGKMPGRGVKFVAQTQYIVENVRAFLKNKFKRYIQKDECN